MLLLPNAGECAYDRNPHVGGFYRSLDAKSAAPPADLCYTVYAFSGGVTEGCCPQAFSDLATTRRANDAPRKRQTDLKLRQHLPGNRALLATNCENDQEAKL